MFEARTAEVGSSESKLQRLDHHLSALQDRQPIRLHHQQPLPHRAVEPHPE